MFSATWPLSVQDIAHDLLKENHIKVTVGTGGSRLTASQSVAQFVHVVESGERPRWRKLVELLGKFERGQLNHGQRVIVFANRKVTVTRIADYCKQRGLAVVSS
jgi:superfamily II DNA/RNA helicase